MKKTLSMLSACAVTLVTMVQAKTKVMVEVEDVPKPSSEVRKVALVVQNHAASGSGIPFMALTDALTAKLSGRGFQVVNPYNAIGNNLNRTAAGEKMPEISALEIGRKLKADGAITASVLEFLDSTLGTPPILHQFSVRISLNLADAQTGATVCGETVKLKSPKYTNNQVNANRQEYLGDLMFAAAEECARRLLRNENVREWKPTPPPPPKQPKPPAPPPGPMFDKIVDRLTVKMLSDSTFNKEYDELKTRGGRIPIVINGDVKNESGRPDLDAGLKVAAERFLDKLKKTEKFNIKADAATETAIAERLVKAVGTEKDDLINELKQHGSPDLYVVWELKHSTDLDGTGYYNFVLTISHLRKPGGVFWRDLHTLKMPLKSYKEMSK